MRVGFLGMRRAPDGETCQADPQDGDTDQQQLVVFHADSKDRLDQCDRTTRLALI